MNHRQDHECEDECDHEFHQNMIYAIHHHRNDRHFAEFLFEIFLYELAASITPPKTTIQVRLELFVESVRNAVHVLRDFDEDLVVVEKKTSLVYDMWVATAPYAPSHIDLYAYLRDPWRPTRLFKREIDIDTTHSKIAKIPAFFTLPALKQEDHDHFQKTYAKIEPDFQERFAVIVAECRSYVWEHNGSGGNEMEVDTFWATEKYTKAYNIKLRKKWADQAAAALAAEEASPSPSISVTEDSSTTMSKSAAKKAKKRAKKASEKADETSGVGDVGPAPVQPLFGEAYKKAVKLRDQFAADMKKAQEGKRREEYDHDELMRLSLGWFQHHMIVVGTNMAVFNNNELVRQERLEEARQHAVSAYRERLRHLEAFSQQFNSSEVAIRVSLEKLLNSLKKGATHKSPQKVSSPVTTERVRATAPPAAQPALAVNQLLNEFKNAKASTGDTTLAKISSSKPTPAKPAQASKSTTASTPAPATPLPQRTLAQKKKAETRKLELDLVLDKYTELLASKRLTASFPGHSRIQIMARYKSDARKKILGDWTSELGLRGNIDRFLDSQVKENHLTRHEAYRISKSMDDSSSEKARRRPLEGSSIVQSLIYSLVEDWPELPADFYSLDSDLDKESPATFDFKLEYDNYYAGVDSDDESVPDAEWETTDEDEPPLATHQKVTPAPSPAAKSSDSQGMEGGRVAPSSSAPASKYDPLKEIQRLLLNPALGLGGAAKEISQVRQNVRRFEEALSTIELLVENKRRALKVAKENQRSGQGQDIRALEEDLSKAEQLRDRCVQLLEEQQKVATEGAATIAKVVAEQAEAKKKAALEESAARKRAAAEKAEKKAAAQEAKKKAAAEEAEKRAAAQEAKKAAAEEAKKKAAAEEAKKKAAAEEAEKRAAAQEAKKKAAAEQAEKKAAAEEAEKRAAAQEAKKRAIIDELNRRSDAAIAAAQRVAEEGARVQEELAARLVKEEAAAQATAILARSGPGRKETSEPLNPTHLIDKFMQGLDKIAGTAKSNDNRDFTAPADQTVSTTLPTASDLVAVSSPENKDTVEEVRISAEKLKEDQRQNMEAERLALEASLIQKEPMKALNTHALCYDWRGINLSLGLWKPPYNHFSTLELWVEHWYSQLCPKEDSITLREELINRLQVIFNRHYPDKDLVLRPFGSFITGLGNTWSDIDICIFSHYPDPSDPYADVSNLAQMLRQHGMENIVAVTDAKVPIVKFVDPATKIACDMNVQKPLGIYNSLLIKAYLDIDERLGKFLYLLKYFAKTHGILDGSSGFLCSYAFILMAIVFFQEQEEPILPRLQVKQERPLTADDLKRLRRGDPIYQHRGQPGSRKANSIPATFGAALRDGKVLVEYVEQDGKMFDVSYDNRTELYRKNAIGSLNKKSVAQLLFEFFEYFSRKFDYRTMEVSSKHGRFQERHAMDKEKKWQMNEQLNTGIPSTVSAKLAPGTKNQYVFDLWRQAWLSGDELAYFRDLEANGGQPSGRVPEPGFFRPMTKSDEGAATGKTATVGTHGGPISDDSFLCVMDPFIYNRNVAGTCRGERLGKVWKCFDYAYKCLALGNFAQAFQPLETGE
ncbi:hypothetical protein EMPS_06519 [Entomortierella parvispora]|uniref:polynucleotide adenylyltransferase n=1 Tax=Entomortierella parvispora TaxID=205924 RepID=A0A9P3HCQ5_9FUNG|nr:hypothetical protein EMPS_06519 [Entomortierella parvispora]